MKYVYIYEKVPWVDPYTEPKYRDQCLCQVSKTHSSCTIIHNFQMTKPKLNSLFTCVEKLIKHIFKSCFVFFSLDNNKIHPMNTNTKL